MVVLCLRLVTPVATAVFDAHVSPYQAGFASVLGGGAFVNLEALDASVPMVSNNVPVGTGEDHNEEV